MSKALNFIGGNGDHIDKAAVAVFHFEGFGIIELLVSELRYFTRHEANTFIGVIRVKLLFDSFDDIGC